MEITLIYLQIGRGGNTKKDWAAELREEGGGDRVRKWILSFCAHTELINGNVSNEVGGLFREERRREGRKEGKKEDIDSLLALSVLSC